MADHIYLNGSEDVLRASYNMQSAAGDMQQAARNIEGTLEQNQRFMDDWLCRLEAVMRPEKIITKCTCHQDPGCPTHGGF